MKFLNVNSNNQMSVGRLTVVPTLRISWQRLNSLLSARGLVLSRDIRWPVDRSVAQRIRPVLGQFSRSTRGGLISKGFHARRRRGLGQSLCVGLATSTCDQSEVSK